MKINRIHGFDISFSEAKTLQERLSGQVRVESGPNIREINTVAGCDCAFDRRTNLAFGAVVLCDFPSMSPVGILTAHCEIRFPYVPGYLSFRELEVLLSLFERLEKPPDIVIADGQGIAHPRRIGLASHLGLFLEIPTIGCAKSRLIGESKTPGLSKGEWSPLFDRQEIIGAVVRTKKGVKPLFVSPGHLIDLEKAREMIIACSTKYRLPEPSRIADIEVAKYKKEVIDE
jgi:deoxyribonuclease V